MSVLVLRAVRGATTVASDDPELIRKATEELLDELLGANALDSDHVVSALFTVTPDLCSEFAAQSARRAGWDDVPMICAQEADIDGALPRCIRVLLHVHTARARSEMRHVYLREAITLRPDLAQD
jgi:chorismate mutase